jgi:hypothetical protein
MDKKNWEIAPTTFEQLTIRHFRRRGNLIWFFTMFLVNFVGVLAQFYYNETQYVRSSILLGFIGVLFPPVWAWARDQLIDLDSKLMTFVDLSDEEISQFTHNVTHQSMTGNWLKWACGIAIVAGGSITILSLGVPFQNHMLRLISFVALIPLFFFCGTALYNYVRALSIPLRLSKLPIRVPLYQDEYTGVTSLTPLVFGFSVIALLFYVLLFFGVIAGPYPLDILMLGWLSTIGVLAASVLPIALSGLHNAMKSAKRDILSKLAPQLEEATRQAITDPTKENVEITESLLGLRKELQELPEWPIDFRTLLTLLTTALFPILTFTFELIK